MNLIIKKVLPLKSTLPPAPKRLLKVILCKCKLNCDTKKCTCLKLGIESTVGCGECHEVNCSNSVRYIRIMSNIGLDEARRVLYLT